MIVARCLSLRHAHLLTPVLVRSPEHAMAEDDLAEAERHVIQAHVLERLGRWPHAAAIGAGFLTSLQERAPEQTPLPETEQSRKLAADLPGAPGERGGWPSTSSRRTTAGRPGLDGTWRTIPSFGRGDPSLQNEGVTARAVSGPIEPAVSNKAG